MPKDKQSLSNRHKSLILKFGENVFFVHTILFC